jgi:RNA polymerase-binding protein DksA
MSVDVDRFREALLEERQRVQGARRYIREEHPRSDDEMPLGTHLADDAALTFDQELDETLEENSSNVLAEIDAALVRIDEGTFGTCATCGKEIPTARLEAVPWATLCIDCKRQEEAA